MESKCMPNDKTISNLIDEELNEIALDRETLKTIEAVIKEHSQFSDMNFIQLNDSEEFQRALKDYRIKNPVLVKIDEGKNIESLISIIPKTFAIANNKLSNEITKDFANNGDILLAVINVGGKNEVRTYNSLSYEGENITITGKHEFTAYDRAIHNAVCSLYAAGNDIVTPAMVYRAVNGMSDNEKVSPQSVEAVINSLDKSRFMRLKVDFTEEAKARGWEVDKTTLDSYLLNATLITVEAGRNKVEAYKIHAVPALYQYSQRTKQIISIPLGLLDTKGATRNTEEIISIKEYLVRRIEIMKNDSTMNNKIVYDTIFEETNIVIKYATERDRYRKYIKDILSLWKTRDKYFKEYKEYKIGKIIKGLEICF